jgi:hypothetical protein
MSEGNVECILGDASSPRTGGVILASFAELLIDPEKDPHLGAVLVGMLREGSDRVTPRARPVNGSQ